MKKARPTTSIARLKTEFSDLYKEGKTKQALEVYLKIASLEPNSTEHNINLSKLYKSLGEITEALKHANRAKEINPKDVTARINLGNLLKQSGQTALAIESLREAVALSPSDVGALEPLMVTLFELRDPIEPLSLASQILKLDPNHLKAVLVSAEVHTRAGEPQMAISWYGRALDLAPDTVEVLVAQARCLIALSRTDEAIISLVRAIRVRKDYSEGIVLLNQIYQDTNRIPAAISLIKNALTAKADDVSLIKELAILEGVYDQNLDAFTERLCQAAEKGPTRQLIDGRMLQKISRIPESEQFFHSCVERFFLRGKKELLLHFGIVCQEQGYSQWAQICYEKSLLLGHISADLHNNLGVIHHSQKQFPEALKSFSRALEIDPNSINSNINKARTLYTIGDHVSAQTLYQSVLKISPSNPIALMSSALSLIPAIPSSEHEIIKSRSKLLSTLHELNSSDILQKIDSPELVVGAQQPFYLAYQPFNNKEILSVYGEICSKLMSRWQKYNLRTPNFKVALRKKIRVGIASKFFYRHSVWDALIKGWLIAFDRSKFDIYCFNLGAKTDNETEFARLSAEGYHSGTKGLRGWANCILDHELDVLIYPEIGMDSLTVQLASMRLAPIQCTSWGHPETSGLPTIDYYLSSELMEPFKAQESYNERLCRLRNFGCYYPVFPDIPFSKSSLRQLRNFRPTFVFPGSPFKYSPIFDEALLEIKRRLHDCRFILFSYYDSPQLTNLLVSRLQSLFLSHGIKSEDCFEIRKWSSLNAFYETLADSTLVLDTIGFSGFNTALHALKVGVPIVTLEGGFMRGRFGSAILKRIKLGDLVAGSIDEYVSIAEKLVGNADFREDVKQRISRFDKTLLFEDQHSIKEMETLLFSFIE